MKKISILTLGLLAAASMSAQTSLVKEADKTFKGVNDYASYMKAVDQITPAFTNDETKGNAQTFWIPGKAGFKLYDDMYSQKLIGKNPDLIQMGEAAAMGYNYGILVLPVVTEFIAKGKMSPNFGK